MSRFALSTKPDDLVPTKYVRSALIGLGGNVGQVVQAMQRAVNELNKHRDCAIIAVSKVYRTPPWGIKDQDWFYNACAEIETSLPAEELLDLLLSIELHEGRVRDQRWGPRTLDLDIIAIDDEQIDTDRLHVPHRLMGERAFVIVPLLDIAPDRIIAGKSVRDYASVLDLSDIEMAGEELALPTIALRQ